MERLRCFLPDVGHYVPSSPRAGAALEAALSLVTKDGLSDQHALNTVVAGRWTALDPRWNVMTHYYAPSMRWEYASAARDRTAIRHFTVKKPWLFERKGLGAGRFHDVSAELREVNPEAWETLKQAATR
ncbi:hypothetical protein Nm8I071_22900 [Nonomuraea sp. TT08I-71]|nr:hypothetical protein Nm8I071_22900 [Nonomuraea sp. TT08I-71]